jgi:hypothetical protein
MLLHCGYVKHRAMLPRQIPMFLCERVCAMSRKKSMWLVIGPWASPETVILTLGSRCVRHFPSAKLEVNFPLKLKYDCFARPAWNHSPSSYYRCSFFYPSHNSTNTIQYFLGTDDPELTVKPEITTLLFPTDDSPSIWHQRQWKIQFV